MDNVGTPNSTIRFPFRRRHARRTWFLFSCQKQPCTQSPFLVQSPWAGVMSKICCHERSLTRVWRAAGSWSNQASCRFQSSSLLTFAKYQSFKTKCQFSKSLNKICASSISISMQTWSSKSRSIRKSGRRCWKFIQYQAQIGVATPAGG